MVNLTKVKEIVEHILINNPNARNSDKELIRLFLLHQDLYIVGVDGIEAPTDLWPHFESIRRSRQILQSHNLYLADPEVEDMRKKEEQEWKKIFSGGFHG